MREHPEWFAAKRYGYGAGLPISWQGWLLTIGFVALSVGVSLVLAKQPVAIVAALIPLTLGFTLICARTTKGGWRWRWGNRD